MKSILFFIIILFKYDRLYYILKIFKNFYDVWGMFLQVLWIVSFIENILNIFENFYDICGIFPQVLQIVSYTENIRKFWWCMWYVSAGLTDCIIYWKYSKIVMIYVVCLCRFFLLCHRSHICYTCVQLCFSIELYTFFFVFQVELFFSEVGQAHIWLYMRYSM